MKKLELYQCELCNIQYNDKKKAIECEKSHRIPNDVTSGKYRSFKSNPKGYPDYVDITFDDNSVVRYEQKKEIYP